MTAVLFLCGIVFVIYTYGGPESINTGDLLSISSVFAAFVSHLSKFNHFIPTPASADKHICIPYPYRFHGGTGQYGSAFSRCKIRYHMGSAAVMRLYLSLLIILCRSINSG